MKLTTHLFSISIFLSASGPAEAADVDFRAQMAAKFTEAEKQNASVVTGSGDGWLFLAAELRFLSLEKFWGAEAVKVSRATKADVADPLPAIVDFHKQLAARGIALLLVPVPPKAGIYPDKIAPEFSAITSAAPALAQFYQELREAGVDVLDLTARFREQRGSDHGEVFCRTDTHWSGYGCVLAAQAIAAKIEPKLDVTPPANRHRLEWKNVAISGDLVPSHTRVTIAIRSVDAPAVEPDSQSPLLVIGDSHTLVFHDFLAQHAGLIDQLAAELGVVPDLIGTRGSGATAVRIDLYRRASKNPDWLAKKKVVVWCFAAREFSEATQGWPKLPVAK